MADIRYKLVDLFYWMLVGAHRQNDCDMLESVARSANKRLSRDERKELNISWGYYLDMHYPDRKRA